MNKKSHTQKRKRWIKMSVSTYSRNNYLKYQYAVNALIIRQRKDWIKETRTCNVLPTKNSLQGKWYTQTDSEGMENTFGVNGNDKKARQQYYIRKTNFKTKDINRDKAYSQIEEQDKDAHSHQFYST